MAGLPGSNGTARVRCPADPDQLLRTHKRLRRELRAIARGPKLKVAILGGSTTAEVANLLELFLLTDGFQPEIHESRYDRYYEDAVFGNDEIDAFGPDFVYVHTTTLNLPGFPDPFDSPDLARARLDEFYDRLASVWDHIEKRWGAAIIQNNFEPPFARPLGSLDSVVESGRTVFVNRLNDRLADRARRGSGFHVHDLAYLASWFGLERWYDKQLWYRSKYAMSYDAMPAVARGVASIIRATRGQSKKCLVVDLDNTVWGGVIGDDGAGGIRLGQGSPEGEAYLEVQQYLQALRRRGILLAACSKNDETNALQGLSHPDSLLARSDFTAARINWRPKSENVVEIAREIGIGADSLVFLDDNPVERQLVAEAVPGIGVPDVEQVTGYITALDKSGFFEPATLSREDAERQRYYADNARRAGAQERFVDYHEFLESLEMKARFGPFSPLDLDRITQLVNKTNQFNLTARRFNRSELEAFAADAGYLTLSGRLADRYGDNGLVTAVLGRFDREVLHLDLWVMSCRVLARDLERAVFGELGRICRARGIATIRGYHVPTAKNGLVADHYPKLGFEPAEPGSDGSTSWVYDLAVDREEGPVPIRVVSVPDSAGAGSLAPVGGEGTS